MAVAIFARRFVLKSIQLADGRKMSFLHHVCEKEDVPTIVFVHGFPLDHSMWMGQMPLLEQASLLMPDLFGFGASDPIAEGASMRSMADDVAGLLERLGIEKVIWCGLSMGGYIGWEFVKNHERKLEGLICCNTRASADDESTARARRFAASQVMKTGAGPVAEVMRGKLFSDSTIMEKPEVVDSIIKVICNSAPETIAAAQIAMSQRNDFLGLLPEINIRTLVISGSEDPITTASEMQRMSFEIRGATFVELSKAGHMSPLEQPLLFNRALIHWLNF